MVREPAAPSDEELDDDDLAAFLPGQAALIHLAC